MKRWTWNMTQQNEEQGRIMKHSHILEKRRVCIYIYISFGPFFPLNKYYHHMEDVVGVEQT